MEPRSDESAPRRRRVRRVGPPDRPSAFTDASPAPTSDDPTADDPTADAPSIRTPEIHTPEIHTPETHTPETHTPNTVSTPEISEPVSLSDDADLSPVDRSLRGLVGGGSSQLKPSAAMRARDAARPRPQDLERADAELVIVRRNWTPSS